MFKGSAAHTILKFLIALVWLINGLFCKVLDTVPRHQQIVAEILGYEYAGLLTKAIGVSEIAMAAWILSGIKSRLNTIIQILIIATMNTLEFFLVPNLLLFGKLNSLVALLFITLIYFNEFKFNPRKLIPA